MTLLHIITEILISVLAIIIVIKWRPRMVVIAIVLLAYCTAFVANNFLHMYISYAISS